MGVAASRLNLELADTFTSSATFQLGDRLDKLDVLVRGADAVCELLIAGTWRDGFELARGIGVSRPGLDSLYEREGGIRGIRFRNRTAGEDATLSMLDLYTVGG